MEPGCPLPVSRGLKHRQDLHSVLLSRAQQKQLFSFPVLNSHWDRILSLWDLEIHWEMQRNLWLFGFFFFNICLLRQFWGQREKQHWVNTESPVLPLSDCRRVGSATVWDPCWTMWESGHLLSMLSITKGRKLHWNVKLLPWFTFQRRTGGVSSGLTVTCETLGTGRYFKQTKVPAALPGSYHVACLFQRILENLLLRALASARHFNAPTTAVPFGVCSTVHL